MPKGENPTNHSEDYLIGTAKNISFRALYGRYPRKQQANSSHATAYPDRQGKKKIPRSSLRKGKLSKSLPRTDIVKQLDIFAAIPQHDPAIAAAIQRQRAIALHFANLDIQALNRQCLEERKARYLSTNDPFKKQP